MFRRSAGPNVAGVTQQLERHPSDPAGQPRPRTVVISEGVDAATPVLIEVVVDKDGPVSLELLTKLLIVSAVFLATRHIAPSVAIVGAILSAFIPDVITSAVRRRRWGKKRVGILAALLTLFGALDSAFGKTVGDRVRKAARPGRGGTRRALGLGHAMATTAAATAVCAIVIAVPAVASGGSPFPTARAHTPTTPAVAPLQKQTQAPTQRTQQPQPQRQPQQPPQQQPRQTTHDQFVPVDVSPTGAPGSVTIAPGQRVHFEFTLQQSSRVIFAIGTGGTLSAFNLWRDDNQDGSSSLDIDSANPYIPADLTAGPHTITVQSTDTHDGTLRYVLYASTDLTQTAGVSAAGVPDTVTVTPGQRAHLEFTLKQASRVVLAVDPNSTLTAYSIWRDDNQDGSSSLDIDSANPYIPADLTAGPHTITIEPSGASAGTLRYVLYASTDQTETIDASPRGTAGSVTVTPGQRAHLEFTLRQPGRIVLAVDPNSTLTAYSIWRDDNQDGSSSLDIDSTHPYAPSAILAAGTHTITIESGGASAGTLRFNLSAPPG